MIIVISILQTHKYCNMLNLENHNIQITLIEQSATALLQYGKVLLICHHDSTTSWT